jgi:condensin complex subunit 3
MEEELDDVLPEVTRHAFYIQHYNNLWQQASKANDSDYEFIVAQLLGIGKRLDYADEVGRRKMYSVLRKETKE